ncbi:uncharacterized protein LOC135481085 [Liolophura sinensis]|uniref:uncharacterized protein LOC135481085 n=1 Tax=Liolophura sinensis TaxID=3198878 RepID=UPI003158C596
MLFLIACGALFAGVSAQIDLRPYNLSAAIMFVNNDLNNDGFLTAHEFDQVFVVYDFNDDKIIERHEYVCYITRANPLMGHLAQALYDEYDNNNDHKLEVADYDAFYKKMDEDGDNIVTDLEFVRYWEALFLKTEAYSLKGQSHATHTDKYCLNHGHAHG